MEPQVTDYLSCTDYLRDYYLFRKGKNKNFSYESWSREIGYSHRSNLRLAVKGDRGLSTQLEKCIEQKIIKTVHQVRYFRLLCEIQRTKSLDKKSALQKKAMALQKYRTKTVGTDQG
ncbi:MAG: hypothetical protein J7501_09185, partial [Bdellovibrio sp.]|nr:hypothetical protein [Bdellovibrio sp.]